MKINNRQRIGSLYNSPIWKECWSAMDNVFRLKQKKRTKYDIEFIGYSKYFEFPKCYGCVAIFKMDTYNGSMYFDGFALLT